MTIDNEVFDSQNESFLILIDSIDSAIIDLIQEDMTLSEVDEIAMSLVENTFSFLQSEKNEQEVLKNLIGLRAKKIETSVDKKSFVRLKRSGANLRLYLEIIEEIDTENKIWMEVENSLDENWIDFLFENLGKLKGFNWELNNFSIPDNELTLDLLKKITRLWMHGENYGTIASQTGLEIDTTLNIINNIIGYTMNNVISTIIRVKEQLLNDDEDLPETVIDWPIYLQNGMKHKSQLILFQLGFVERIGLLKISKELVNNFGDGSLTLKSVSAYLIKNEKKLLKSIQNEIPIISLRELKKNFSYMTKKLW